MLMTKDAPKNAVYALHVLGDPILVHVDVDGEHRAYIHGVRERFFDVSCKDLFSAGFHHAHLIDGHVAGYHTDITPKQIKQWVKHVQKCMSVVGDNNLNQLAWLGGFNPLKK